MLAPLGWHLEFVRVLRWRHFDQRDANRDDRVRTMPMIAPNAARMTVSKQRDVVTALVGANLGDLCTKLTDRVDQQDVPISSRLAGRLPKSSEFTAHPCRAKARIRTPSSPPLALERAAADSQTQP